MAALVWLIRVVSSARRCALPAKRCRLGSNEFGVTNVPPDLTNAIAIAGGRTFSVAIRADGTVVEWGSGAGSGAQPRPDDLSNVVAVAASDAHVLALRGDGTIVSWRNNYSGQPVLSNFSNVIAIATGTEHALVVQDNGTVIAWGRNNLGQTNVCRSDWTTLSPWRQDWIPVLP